MRLIDADVLKTLFDVRYDTAFIQERTRENKEQWNGYCTGINWGINTITAAPTVDALVFPCKVGDTVWFLGTSNTNRLNLGVIETTVEKLVLKKGGIYMKLSCNAMYETSCRSIGKSVFFSREEAEAALAKMG